MPNYVLTLALSEDYRRVAVIKKLRGPALVAGRYNFPGGHVEADEEFEDAAVRELAEETGLVVLAKDLIPLASKGLPGQYALHAYAVVVSSFEDARSMTDEAVSIKDISAVFENWFSNPAGYGPDFMTLLVLALDTARPRTFAVLPG